MCMSTPKMPPPPAAAPVYAPPAPAQMLGATEDNRRTDASVTSRNRGRNSLRIDRTETGTGAVGSGLNIPS